MTKVIDVDLALNASNAAQEALASATTLVERKRQDLCGKMSAAKSTMDAAQAAVAELLADTVTPAALPRALLEKAMNANEKSAAMLKLAAELVGAVGVAGTITSPIDEWKECRVTIDRFDKILVDLRKTGFGFVTAIAAAAQFLFTDAYSFDAKVALLALLVFLIITLYLIDLAHQEWLDVAVKRAELIENQRFSKAIFLTSAISAGFSPFRAIWLGLVLYAVLLIATCAAFFFSVPRNEIWLSGHHCFVGLICGVGLAVLGGACGFSVFHRKDRKVVPS